VAWLNPVHRLTWTPMVGVEDEFVLRSHLLVCSMLLADALDSVWVKYLDQHTAELLVPFWSGVFTASNTRSHGRTIPSSRCCAAS
jgi:hypothetical protein